MSSVEIEICGFIRTEPETRYTQGGEQTLSFSVPHQPKKDGETEWYSCVIYGEKRASALNWLKKGMGVFIRGTLTINQSGDKVYRNVFVNQLQVLFGKRDEEEELPF